MSDIKKLEFVMNGITMSITDETVDKVMADFERENPLRTADSMSSKEFADRMMNELEASAFSTTKGNA